MKAWKWVVLLGWTALVAPNALAQAGKLAGRVVDAASNEPIPGATVFLNGTTLGTVTDANGDYVVLNIPPGTYSVRYSIVGFQTQVVEGVLIKSNQTTEQNVALGEEVIQGEEVVVTAQRPIVDVTLTSSMQTLSRDDIAVLPVQQLDEIVNLQAGVVDGHFRGGRLGEVQYQVDGVSVNNPYDNVSTLQLDRSLLQEVQVIQGTFDAKYGQAMSGVVNAVLRNGDPNRYEFSAEAFMGDYVSPGSDSTVVQYNQLGRQFVDTVAVFPYIDDLRPTVLQNYQVSLSGPVPLVPGTTFLFNGQRYVDDGHLTARRVFNPSDTSDVEANVYFPTGDRALVPLNFERKWGLLAKLSNRSIPRVQLDYQAIANWLNRRSCGGDASVCQSYRFNPEGTKTAEQFSIVHGLDWTHTLTDRFFYKVSVRQNYFDYKDLKFEDIGTALPGAGTLYLLPENSPYNRYGRPISDLEFDKGSNAVLQGVDLSRFVQFTNSLLGKLEVTNQVTKVHLVEAGIEAQTSELRFGTPGRVVALGDPLQLYVQRDTAGARVDEYKPVYGSLYLQDRVEVSDLRVRAGVRVEYFDANATVPSDLQNPANSIDDAPESLPEPTTVKLVLAPRLGISFPILQGASMFFSYGHFYQMPPLRDMFANADYSVLEDLQAGAVDYGVLGNPDLKPELTTQYEFGFKSEITSDFGVDLSLFYKDIRDLLGVEFVSTYTAAEYARLTNVDFGGVRGFTLTLDHRALGPLSVSVDYTLQQAVGNSSDPKETANRAEAGEDPRPRQVPFNWDQRHTLNGSVIWYRPGSFALTGIVKFASGQPYTPSISTGFDADLETNSGRKPASVIVDLRAEKFFRLGGVNLTAFARVFNLLDEHFNNGFVYADTGSPYYTLIPDQQRSPNPGRLYPPRRIEIGLSLNGALPR